LSAGSTHAQGCCSGWSGCMTSGARNLSSSATLIQNDHPSISSTYTRVPHACGRAVPSHASLVTGNRTVGLNWFWFWFWSREVGVRKTAFLRCHLYRKTIILPRQARDKHRESTQNRCRLSQAEGGSWRMLRETPATLLSANGNLPAAPQTHHAHTHLLRSNTCFSVAW
jgi:hypothetical protein